MIQTIHAHLTDPKSMSAILAGVFVFATILTIAAPYLSTDKLGERMKSVAGERERLRLRERERLTKRETNVNLRMQPKAYMKRIVENFNLSQWLGAETAKSKLQMAGYRGPQSEVTFLFFRLVSPILFVVMTVIYIFIIINPNWMTPLKFAICVAAAYVGVKAPEIFLSNVISKRQLSIQRAFPDAMDLLLICVESGIAIESAFRRVSQEIGSQSSELAEELALTTAELSYLPDRRTAYANLAARTGLEGMKQLSTVLVQAEKYGTPLATALRVVSQEGRDQRMMLAEKKAASLPPKLTVPMMLFFLPVIFVVLLTPAILQTMQNWK